MVWVRVPQNIQPICITNQLLTLLTINHPLYKAGVLWFASGLAAFRALCVDAEVVHGHVPLGHI